MGAFNKRKGITSLIGGKILFSISFRTGATIELKHNLDVMHVEKNVCDSLLGTLLAVPHKSKDTNNAMHDLENLGIRKELHLYDEGNKFIKLVAEYILT